jgi:putative PIG3 family NAD(P)H quinone oxidoreductase
MKDLMRAVCIREPGAPDVLEAVEISAPEPRESEVLIEVAAAGVNRPDVLQRLGQYPVPVDADPLPGLEVAGRVVGKGAHADRWAIGDKVMALTHGGGYAEYCRVNERHCLPVPDALGMVKAAAIPETFFTVWYNVFMRGGLGAGETILVHGGSSGIGTTAIQLAKATGATVIVTAGSAEKCAFCEELGADHAIDYRHEDWEVRTRELTGGNGVDLVLDMVAGSYMQKNLNTLARDGRYVIIAFLQGPTAELNMRRVLTKRLTITGSTLRPQTTAEKATIAAELATHVLPLLESGEVKPIIHTTFPLEDASEAHRLMESSRHMGKIVLET